MLLSLQTSTKQEIGSLNSSYIPRIDEHIKLNNCLFQVTSVCYQVSNQECHRIDIEIKPVNDAARQYISETLLEVS